MSSLSDAEDDHDPGDAVMEKAAGRAPENDNPAARGIDALHGSASDILRQISELADETEISFGAIVDALEERAFGMLIFLTAFEILVAFLQAYIFAILAAVYINNSTVGHAEDH